MVPNAQALEVGVGIDMMNFDYLSSGVKIYVPLDITPKFRIEPSFLYWNDESTTTDSSGTVSTFDYRAEFGLGFFGIQDLAQQTKLYYGARLGFVSEKYEYISTVTSTRDRDGYKFSPAFGFEHFFSEKISLGGEVSWYYLDLDIESFTSSSGAGTGSDQSTGTDSEVILRYYF